MTNIKDVIADFCEVRRAGSGWWESLCPFHDDHRLGSFKISERRNTYTCFSCGEHGDAVDFIMKYRGLSFLDAIRYLGKKIGIHVEGDENIEVKRSAPRPIQAQLPTLILDRSMIMNRRDTSKDILCNWLRSLPWTESQASRVEKMINNYAIGHSAQGHTIFWQIDEKGQLRTGKMMLYRPDGHRDKETPHNFDWIHSRMWKAGLINLDNSDVRYTLFGMHLLDFASQATVNIVESEKTALICAIAYGDMKDNIWMATCGKSLLTADRLKPIIDRGRDIVLYPDHDGAEKWAERVQAIGYPRMTISTETITKYWKPEDGEKADLADIIIRLLHEREQGHVAVTGSPVDGRSTLEKMIDKNPALGLLVDALALQPVMA